MLLVIAVGLGGAAGALARYGLDRLIEHHVMTVFPWSTFTINVTGCFLAGLAVAALVDRHDLPAWVRTGIVVGFLGAYTTFSTYMLESWRLIEGGAWGYALANLGGSVAVGVVAVVAGLAIGRAI